MKSSSRRLALLLLAISGLATSPARAHGDEVHSPQTAPNGGQVAVAGAYHLELLVNKDSKEAKANPVVVYLTDKSGNKVASAGASGTATLLSGKVKTTATLAPDGENRLRGTASYAATQDMKVVVSVTMPGKETVQARFTPLADHTERKH